MKYWMDIYLDNWGRADYGDVTDFRDTLRRRRFFGHACVAYWKYLESFEISYCIT